MKNISFFSCFLLMGQLLLAQVSVSSGRVQRFADFPSEFVAARNVDVWLPADYSPEKKYAVLYMHDGQMLFDSTTTWNHQEWGVDEKITALLAANNIQPCIVVGVWNGGAKRHQEYFPQKVYESFSTQTLQQIQSVQVGSTRSAVLKDTPLSDNYLKFLVREVKPMIDRTFSTLPDRAHTFIAGSSMGGLISMYGICEYPKVFGGAACLSTHWTGIFTEKNNPIPAGFADYMRTHLPSPKTHKLYFDYGTATLDSLYKPFQQQIDAVMRQKGYTDAQWITREFPGEDHSERAWRKRLHLPLEFLLKRK